MDGVHPCLFSSFLFFFTFLHQIASKCSSSTATNYAMVCNIFGCNCDNCAVYNVFNIKVGLTSNYCNYECGCQCAAGPNVNKGSNAVSSDGADYVAASLDVRRQIASSRICVPGQLVSLEFLRHAESVMDTDGNGVLTSAEFDNARDASKITLSPGCTLQNAAALLFPSFSKMCPPRHDHAKRAALAPKRK